MMRHIPFRKPLRKAIAAVEFAVVLPLIVILLLGALETARAVMVTHSLQEAAHAGCRVYSVEGSTLAQSKAMVDAAMKSEGLSGYEIAFSPASKSGIDTAMEPVSVTISLPFSKAAWLPPSYLASGTLEGRCVMPADVNESDGGDSNGYADADDDQEYDGNVRHENRNSSGHLGGGGDDDDD